MFTCWLEIVVQKFCLGLYELSKGIYFIINSLINFQTTQVQKGEAVVFQDLTLSKLGYLIELDVKLRRHLFVHKELKNV